MVESFAEVQQGGEREECVVCSDEPPSVKFEPCGHVIACQGKNILLTVCEPCIIYTKY